MCSVLIALCCYVIFVLGREPSSKQVVQTTTGNNNTGDDKIKAEIEAKFQKLVDTEVGNSKYGPVADSVARLAQKAPDVIVHKFLTGDRETRRRALGVMYSFDEVGADTTLLVSSLVDAYKRADQGAQIAILIVFGQAKARSALPFLREVLDDIRLEPPPPPGVQGGNVPDRMCHTAYNQILRILENMKIQHGLKESPNRRVPKDILKMKQWLDSHPEVMKAAKSALEKLKSGTEK